MDQHHIDMLVLVGVPLKRTANTGGGEYHGPCPVCGGQDRFVVQPQGGDNGGRCMCRQCHPHWMDAIGFVQWKRGITFTEALKELQLTVTPKSKRQQRKPAVRLSAVNAGELREGSACFDPAWQTACDPFVTECCNRLWDHNDNPAIGYLRTRQLSDAATKACELGWNSVNRKVKWGETDVWLPRGIVIPWQIEGIYWRVRIRRFNEDIVAGKDSKYINVAGSANGLYGADLIDSKSLVVLVESEFDALTIRDHAAKLKQSHSLAAVATGGTNNARLLRWVTRLSLAQHVFLAFDDDANGAGDLAVNYWKAVLGAKATRLKPTCHDVNDMALAGENITDWILQAVAVL